jgi:hypothetical protein
VSVCAFAEITGKLEVLSRIMDGLLKTYDDTVLIEKMFQFKLPSWHSVRNTAGKTPGLSPLSPMGHAGIFGQQQDNGLHDNSRKGYPYAEGRDGRE